MNFGEILIQKSRKLKIGAQVQKTFNLQKHHISRTEAIGTAIHIGFEVIKEEFKHPNLYLDLKKVASPGTLTEIRHAHDLIFRQPRVGKSGKIIQVLKIRTMYPMAHKAYEYFLAHAAVGAYGKPTDDYRVTKLGKFLRQFFIDEIPQLINILRGEMKIVGLPLDEAFFKSLPQSLQQERLKHLPALMAAIYADRPQSLEARFTSEMKYLHSYSKNPLLTDIKYFFKILWSILFRGQRGV